MDNAGNLYGTTQAGGSFTAGTVFELSPPATVGGGWTESILWNFGNTPDGGTPVAGLIMDPSGSLYGTTKVGGKTNSAVSGTVFELLPPSLPGGSWTESVLWNFDGPSGGEPVGKLIMDANGELFGTTQLGGTSINEGAVFRLQPPSTAGDSWTETVLWNFKGFGTDGANPSAGLLMDAQGNIYGTTANGGVQYPGSAIGARGTVFRLNPPSSADGSWTESILWTFGNLNFGDGRSPSADLLMDASGNLFSTTQDGGALGSNGTGGTVFELTNVAATPSATLSTTGIAFGKLPIGDTSVVKTVKVTNAGPSAITFTDISLVGLKAADFQITSNTCVSPLNSSASCVVKLDFSAHSAAGTNESATLVFNDNAANNPQTVALSGTAIAGLAAKPVSLSFGTVTVGQTSPPQNVTVKNNHSYAINLQQAFSGGAASDYQLTGASTCGTTLGPNSQCIDAVALAPTSTGTRAATLSASDTIDAPAGVSLTGTGG